MQIRYAASKSQGDSMRSLVTLLLGLIVIGPTGVAAQSTEENLTP